MTFYPPAVIAQKPEPLNAAGAMMRFRPDVFRLDDIKALPLMSGAYLVDAVKIALNAHGYRTGVLARCEIYVNAVPVPRPKWETIVLREGDQVGVVVPIRGGGGKNIFKTILSVIVMAVASIATWWIGGAGGWSIGGMIGTLDAGVVAGSLAGMAVLYGGMMLVNKIAPMSSPQLALGNDGETAGKIWSIDGTQNRADLYGYVPLALGLTRFAPRLAGQPYTFLKGDKHFARYLFVSSVGRHKVSDVRIGDTSFNTFKGARIKIHENWRGEALSFYPSAVYQEDLMVTLTNTNGSFIRTTSRDTKEIQLEFLFPNGLVVVSNDHGDKGYNRVRIKVEYSPAGANQWKQAFGGYIEIGAQTLTPFRRGYSIQVPTGQYDVRITRIYYVEPYVEHGLLQGYTFTDIKDVSWTVLRSIREGQPIIYQGYPLTLIEAEVQATEQLSGHLSEFNSILESYAPVWNGSQWASAPTNNPASLCLLIGLGNKVLGRPVTAAQIDWEAWQGFYEWCEKMGWKYNGVITSGSEAGDLVQRILSVGRASLAWRDGLISVVWDAPDKPVVYPFGPRNSWGFKASKSFVERQPHALRCLFLNEQVDFQEDEMTVYADGYNAKNAVEIVEVEQDGCTNPDQIWRTLRLRLADSVLRPENYCLSIDIAGLCVKKGDRISVTHDVTMWGLVQCRIASLIIDADDPQKILGVTLDDEITMEPEKLYGFKWFYAGNGQIASQPFSVETVEGTSAQLLFTTPVPTSDAPMEDGLISFGLVGRETQDGIITGIDYGDGLTATIFFQDAAPQVYEALTGDIPPFNSNISVPSRYQRGRPEAPAIITVKTDEEALLALPGGGFMPRIKVGFLLKEKQGVTIEYVTVYYRIKGSGDNYKRGAMATGEESVIFIDNVEEAVEYEFYLTATSTVGVSSGKSPVYATLVIGRTTPPPPPIKVYAEGPIIKWEMPPNSPIDIKGWEVFMGFDADDPFDWTKKISNDIIPIKEFDISNWSGRARRVWVRTVDDLGLVSEAVGIAINLGDALVNNVVWEVLESERLWPGTLTGGTLIEDIGLISNGGLPMWGHEERLPETPMWGHKPMWGAAQMWAAPIKYEGAPMWGNAPMWGGAFESMVYETALAVPDEGSDARFFIELDMPYGILGGIEYAFAKTYPAWGHKPMWGNLRWDGVAGVGAYAPMPNGLAVTAGQVIFLKITTSTNAAALITEIRWCFDVEDLEMTFGDFYVQAGGARLPVPAGAFRWIKSVAFGLKYDEATDNAFAAGWLDKGIRDSSGFLIQGPLINCKNKTGDPVAGIVDITLQGAKGTNYEMARR